MNNNYIEFYYNEEGIFVAEIHKQGTKRLIKNQNNLEKLIEICNKYGFTINQEEIIDRRVFTISREYEEYIESKRKIRKLNIVGNILTNMKLSKKDKTIGTTIVAVTMAAVIAATSIGIGASNNKEQPVDSDVIFQQEQVIDNNDLEEFVEDIYGVAEEITPDDSELQAMVQNNQFHFSYEDRTSRENISNARRYEDIFEKYAHRYGVDKNLLMALAAQESCGDHYGNLGNGPAEGIMQIEKLAHIGSNVSAYNFETGEIETIPVTADKLQDLETNIKIGTMILRTCIENNNYNIPLSLQTYNFGPGNMEEVLSMCSSLENLDKNNLRNDPTNNAWLRYRSFLNIGDPEYVEHVFSYLPNNTDLTIQKRNREQVTISIVNDYQKSFNY